MSLYKEKNSPYYYTRFTVSDKRRGINIRIRESTKSITKADALLYEEQRRQEIRGELAGQKLIEKKWTEAANRWLIEMRHKRSLNRDIFTFKRLGPFLNHLYLSQISKQVIRDIILSWETDGKKPATINRALALIKAILRKAQREWEWIDKYVHIILLPEHNKRRRWLTQEQAKKLYDCLVPHLKPLLLFALATGQRQTNTFLARWEDIDLVRKVWTIPPEVLKTGEIIENPHSVPLNHTAMEVLEKQKGLNSEFVFPYKNTGKAAKRYNLKTWRKALKLAGIEDFHWHDLRHTWASWHVQNGTSLYKLMELGPWKSEKMVRGYAHLNVEHLTQDAERSNISIGGDDEN